MRWKLALLLLIGALAPMAGNAQVTSQRIEQSASEPQNWLTFSGTYSGQRYSTLTQINQVNVKDMEQKWIVQDQVPGAWESNPLVVNGIMYLTERPNDVMAVDARSGKLYWLYRWTPDPGSRVCCGSENRGVAILGDTLYVGTLDAHLIALDSKTGKPVWNTTVADFKSGYSVTMAPLIVHDKVIVGVGGGEFGIRGFVAAFDPKTGKEIWRFYTIPGPGDPGFESWNGDDWKTGGAPVWNMGSFDPALNLVYFGTGNPGPDWNPAQRPGDNLYSDSVLALDPDTGKLKWHFQFTPNDGNDYDSTQVPVLADMDWNGKPAKVMMWANRNGFFYVLDRETGKFLRGAPFVKVNWASGLDANGRPIQTPQGPGQPTYPGNQGGTNWYPPAYSPRTGLFYFSAWENYGSIYRREQADYQPGRNFAGGGAGAILPVPGAATLGQARRGPIDNWTSEMGTGALVAMDPKTGKRAWSFLQYDVTNSGNLVTASDILFAGGNEGYFYAFDAKTGKLLWKSYLGGPVLNTPITYQVGGKQYVSVIAGNVLATFGLRD
ncbi:MAG TPA: PQQ-dependent dehydrogenase, methanol/ethanol family [Rhizomicrobium sp.]|nr:PQQ-dependent dehydrogenase, methanol/ethanol family [Rhizomicrobium sp.]